MQNEAFGTLKKYFSNGDGTYIHFYGNGNGARLFANCFQNGEWFGGDIPDMFVRTDNMAILIEHFEFDSYLSTRKGSKNRQEQYRIQKHEDSIIPTEEISYLFDEIKGKSSYSYYLQNCLNSFERHYTQIGRYKENLEKSGLINNDLTLKVMFLIEDVSPLGSISSDDQGTKPIVLAQCKEFLHLLSERPNVDFVLACSCAGSNQYVWFIDQEDLPEYINNSTDYSNDTFLAFSPKVMGFKFLISPENKHQAILREGLNLAKAETAEF